MVLLFYALFMGDIVPLDLLYCRVEQPSVPFTVY